jgi:hypothetical protein
MNPLSGRCVWPDENNELVDRLPTPRERGHGLETPRTWREFDARVLIFAAGLHVAPVLRHPQDTEMWRRTPSSVPAAVSSSS